MDNGGGTETAGTMCPPLQRGINPDIHTTNQLCPTLTHVPVCVTGVCVVRQLAPTGNDAVTVSLCQDASLKKTFVSDEASSLTDHLHEDGGSL